LWTALWGYAGLILSTPLTVCVVVLGRYVPQFSFLHIILGDEGVLAAEAQYYQRMLAMDYPEAQVVASHFLDEHSLTELYDLLIIPALTMAEHDRHKGTLDVAREEFLFLSVKEMLAEFSEKTLDPDAVSARADSSQPSRIFVLPASDEADETTAAMLAQLLEQAGYPAIALSLGPTLHQTIELMSPGQDDMFCVAALPPFAFARTIAVTRQLRSRYPLTRTIAGVWGFTGNTERALQRFRPGSPDQLVTSLAGAVEYIATGNQTPKFAEA
ncbi:MAG TPA: hypothetical protein VNH18_08265, partial [Bryobacteraceae bacterium]|nr:hypothetical protein [Bryobacteraceae bacterium]